MCATSWRCPQRADGWAPDRGEGEHAWSINQLVGHICGSRLYFASAYPPGRLALSARPPTSVAPNSGRPPLEEAYLRFIELTSEVGDEGLEREIEMIDTPGATLKGWRVLMMMMEHDIHHRSQIDTYAGLNGWDPPDIFHRSAETIADPAGRPARQVPLMSAANAQDWSPPTLDDVRAARERITPLLSLPTPLVRSAALSQRWQAEVSLKLECVTPTSAFKSAGRAQLRRPALR